MKKVFNHISPKFSEMEIEMVKHIPQGGNWESLPVSTPSKRVERIRETGGRTTLYGRLQENKPSYTISTYFNRMGNGTFIHPTQDRLISIREGARLQSFKDKFKFYGTKTSQYKQIGNAVPPLLGRVIAELIKPHLTSFNVIDLFAGAGGMSEGFTMEGFNILGAIEIEKNFFESYLQNHKKENSSAFVLGDIACNKLKKKFIELNKNNKIDVIVGGPPCQGFSLAGLRNPEDKRNQLFKEFVHLVKEIKPEFFVMENVPGILSMRKGEAIKEILQAFRDIGYYVNEPIKLKAEEYGVPQKRRRIFIIGSLKKIKINQPKPLFSEEDESLPNPITVKEAIGDLPIIDMNDGEIEMENDINSFSKYQELMSEKITFKEFYENIKNNKR